MPKEAPPNGDALPRTTSSTLCRWVRVGGYRRCRPSFTVGWRPILVAGSTTCSPTPGPRLPEPTHGRNHGEPVAWRHARRVRRAAWGNGPAAMPAPRPRPTHPCDCQGLIPIRMGLLHERVTVFSGRLVSGLVNDLRLGDPGYATSEALRRTTTGASRAFRPGGSQEICPRRGDGTAQCNSAAGGQEGTPPPDPQDCSLTATNKPSRDTLMSPRPVSRKP
jgi:hypothetical protein